MIFGEVGEDTASPVRQSHEPEETPDLRSRVFGTLVGSGTTLIEESRDHAGRLLHPASDMMRA